MKNCNDNIQKVLFLGSKELGFAVLKKIYNINPNALVGCITINDSEDSRTYFKQYSDFCMENDIKLRIVGKNNELDSIIDDIQPDLCFVVGWYFLIEKHTINKVPHGFIGIHNSILPKYRGFAPLVWQMINGEETAGFSLFDFSDGMDEGNVWLSDSVTIEASDYIADVICKIENKIIQALEKNYLNILCRKIKPTAQKNEEPSYCGKRVPDDGKIDWNRSAQNTYNFIRAQSRPYPGAYFIHNGQKIIVWKADIYEHIIYGTPGQVGIVLEEGVVVVCGDSRGILVREIERESDGKNDISIIKSLSNRF